MSGPISILAAQIPAQPVQPTTVWSLSPDVITVTWSAPDDGGSPITGYEVTFRENDAATYSVETSNCDMSLSLETTCVVPVAAVRASPFSLDWGSSVFVRVSAINVYGLSEASSEGNGAVIVT
jgi:hypothetical protein